MTGAAALVAIQARVIGALVLRETRATFGTSQIGYLWAIITPATGVAILVLIFSLIGRQPPFGSSLALFFATGLLTVEFFIKLSSTLMTAFEANRALLTYPLIREADALIARAILISATYLVIFTLFFAVLVALDLASLPDRPGVVLTAFGLTAAMGFGLGALNAVILSLLPSWAQLERLMTRPLLFVSGVFYIPSLLPPEAVALIWWNPVLHLVEWLRTGYYANYDSAVLTPAYPLAVTVALVLAGLGGERLYRKKRTLR